MLYWFIYQRVGAINRAPTGMYDQFWNGASLGCPADLAPWLRDRGSLTKHIQQRCTRFAVRGVRSGLARIALDESALLGIAPRQLAYSREVFLYADDQPVVFAHSALAREHLRSAWPAVRTLGNKPLGALLFEHPLVERRPLHFKALRSTHPLYQRAVAVERYRPQRLWARRSLFCLHDAPLLVTEVFLPGILLLTETNRVRLSKTTKNFPLLRDEIHLAIAGRYL